MFLSEIKADSGDRSAWGSFWFSPVPFNGNSAHITPDVALQLAAVYACVPAGHYIHHAGDTPG